MNLDLDALARAAGEHAANAIRDELRAIVREELERREQDRILDTAALAKYLGKPSTKAVAMWLSREGGAEVAALAIDLGGRRGWRKSDLDAWLARSGTLRLRGLAGGR